MNINVDKLFPSNTNQSGTRGRRLDIDSLFSNTPLNEEPDISYSSDVLLRKIKTRREKKVKCYYSMLRYCYQMIDKADDDQCTEIVFRVIDTVPDCPEYKPYECIEFISKKLREQFFETLPLDDNSVFITWKNIELRKEEAKQLA